MKPSEYHGCLTGDCPHNRQNECIESIFELLDEQHVEIERLQKLEGDPDHPEDDVAQLRGENQVLAHIINVLKSRIRFATHNLDDIAKEFRWHDGQVQAWCLGEWVRVLSAEAVEEVE